MAEQEIVPPRYENPTPIARGGMGAVYRARDTVLGRDVAIKLLDERYAADSETRARFTREALAAARLSGEPNAITIFDVGEWRGCPFIVMEYLPGGSLQDRLRRDGTQPLGHALAWLEQAARALDAAHGRGVVHRDVKPANLLLDREGDVRVADFGIASAAGMQSLTRTGTVLGTAGYLSPEQATGGRSSPASDRYALGIVAFELLTGTRPFAADSPTAEAVAHAHAAVPSASARRPGLPREVDAVFEKALAKDPEARYASCAEFVADLRDAVTATATATAELPTVPAARPAGGRRRSALLALAGLLAIGLVGAGIATALARDGDDEARAPASPSTLVTTVVTTAPGTTARVTVTATTPAEPVDDDGGGGGGAGGGDGTARGIALTDQATALMGQGRWAEALAVAQEAYSLLEGSGQVYEAYAAYNVGRSLVELGRCEEALPFLDRSESIQGHRAEIDDARARCERGGGRGRGQGQGNDD